MVPAACIHLVPDAAYPCVPSPQEGDFQRNTHPVGGYAGKQAFEIKPTFYLCYKIIQTAAEGQFPRAPLAWLAAVSSRRSGGLGTTHKGSLCAVCISERMDLSHVHPPPGMAQPRKVLLSLKSLLSAGSCPGVSLCWSGYRGRGNECSSQLLSAYKGNKNTCPPPAAGACQHAPLCAASVPTAPGLRAATHIC